MYLLEVKPNIHSQLFLSTRMEFLNVWRSGEESSLSLQCKEGKKVLNLQVKAAQTSLSKPPPSRPPPSWPPPSWPPPQEIREKKAEGQRQGSKGYSGSSCWTPSPSSCHSSCLYLSSPATTSSHSIRPLPTFQAVTSQDPSSQIITRSGKRRKVWEPSELNSILAGQRETFPLQGSRSRRSLNQTYRDTGRTYRDSRKYTGKRTKILAGLPCPPLSPLSSSREEPKPLIPLQVWSKWAS